jgi:outer membrane protein assembly factor BamB
MLSWMRRRWRYLAGAAAVLVAAAIVLYFTYGQRPGDVSNMSVPFTAPVATPPPPPPKKKKKKHDTIDWPIYGYDLQRTHYVPASDAKFVKPPFRQVWSRNLYLLLEFQPIAVKGALYLIRNDGMAFALRTKNGRVIWKRKLGSLAAMSPVYSGGKVFFTLLSGRIVAVNAKNGHIVWANNVGARTESPPLVLRGRVYYGAEDGTMRAVRASDGHPIWTYRTSGDVTAGPAYSKGVLYFGDYGGNVQAVRASNGSLVWKTHEAGLPFGRSGGFYGTPAVAFGRVYVGNLDSKVYSFSASSGKLAWSHSTGGYVYAAPAVAAVPGVTPTVFVGSYDHNFYALNAHTGAARWVYNASGPISGAASVIGKVVYFSTLQTQRTYGLDVRSGRVVFNSPHGSYNPAVTDGQWLYITGRHGQTAYAPLHGPAAVRKKKRPRATAKNSQRTKRPAAKPRHRTHR